eukprot:894207-Prymnesium_polylepis.1
MSNGVRMRMSSPLMWAMSSHASRHLPSPGCVGSMRGDTTRMAPSMSHTMRKRSLAAAYFVPETCWSTAFTSSSSSE